MGRHATKLGESPTAKHASRRSAQRAEPRPPLPYPVRDGRVPPPLQAAIDRRFKRRRSRLAALSAASMLAIGGVAGVSMAMADEPESPGSGEIVFSGNCGTLNLVSATSKPDAAEITVTEGSKVRYTNELGAPAELHVGTDTYDIAAGSSQVFIMNQSAEVAMVPDCHGLFADYDSAQVHVVEAPKAEEQNDSGGDSGPSTGELPDTGSGSNSGSDDSGADAPASGADGGGESPGADGSAQQGGPGVRGEDETGAEATEDPAAGEAEEEDQDVNSFGPTTDGTDDAGDSEFAPAGEEVVAVDPKAVSDGASGLLALVAIVCLVGVSAAVMRTILKQRATT